MMTAMADGCRLCLRDAEQHGGELIASLTANQVRSAQPGFEDVGDLGQSLVPARWPAQSLTILKLSRSRINNPTLSR